MRDGKMKDKTGGQVFELQTTSKVFACNEAESVRSEKKVERNEI